MFILKKCCKCFSGPDAEAHSPVPNIQNFPLGPEIDQQQPTPKVIIDSKHKLEDVKLSEFTPANTNKSNFSYNCPICLRYFSTILILKCCKNYICHFCIDELSKTTKFEIACPHCKSIPVAASDVDLSSTVRRYSDSPYSTLKQSKNNAENKWVSMNVVNEDFELEESQQLPDLKIQNPENKEIKETPIEQIS